MVTKEQDLVTRLNWAAEQYGCNGVGIFVPETSECFLFGPDLPQSKNINALACAEVSGQTFERIIACFLDMVVSASCQLRLASHLNPIPDAETIAKKAVEMGFARAVELLNAATPG